MAGTREIAEGFEALEILGKTGVIGIDIFKNLRKTTRRSLDFVSGDTMKSFTITAAANVSRIVFEMPSFSGAVVTGVVSIENSDGVKIYASSAQAENDIYVLKPDPSVFILGTNTIKVTLNTDPLSSGTCYLTLYLEGDKCSH